MRDHKTTRSLRKQNTSLASLDFGEEGVIEQIDLPTEEAHRLMELGFLPGKIVLAKHGSPFGHTRVFCIDGAEVALRRETASHLILRGDTTSKMS